MKTTRREAIRTVALTSAAVVSPVAVSALPGESRRALVHEVEQLRVQLAGCLTIAEGYGNTPTTQHLRAKEGDYGWSLAYQRTLELRQRSDKVLDSLRNARAIQCSNGNWDYDHYMFGMANAIIFAVAVLEGREPIYLNPPEVWLSEAPRSRVPSRRPDHKRL